MQNWKDYIDEKFAKTDDFDWKNDTDCLTITHKLTKTSFWFYLDSENWNNLADVQFTNERTRGWSGDYKASDFSQKEVELLDNFLKPAIEIGWISKDTYIGKKHWKSIVYFNSEMKGIPFKYYSSDNGILSTFLLPITAIIALVLGTKKIVRIPPTDK